MIIDRRGDMRAIQTSMIVCREHQQQTPQWSVWARKFSIIDFRQASSFLFPLNPARGKRGKSN